VGIRPVDAVLLANLAPPSVTGRVATFGVQNVAITGEGFTALCAKRGISLPKAPVEGELNAAQLFACLNLPSVTAFDISPYESAEVIVDLSIDEVPTEHWSAYDLVFDGGTMEHISNLSNFLTNATNMVRPGGAIVHLNPLNGYVDHGFFQFSPTFYLDLYAANNWEVEMCQIVSELDHGWFATTPYERDLYYADSPREVNRRKTMRRATLFVAARKPLQAHGKLRLPVQFFYAQGLEPRREARFPKSLRFSLPDSRWRWYAASLYTRLRRMAGSVRRALFA
jgi:hypothetical protein